MHDFLQSKKFYYDSQIQLIYIITTLLHDLVFFCFAKNKYIEQMDMIRLNTMQAPAIQNAAKRIINVKSRLTPYIREQTKASELCVNILNNKSVQGRLYGKFPDDKIVGKAKGYKARWSTEEMITLRFSLLFLSKYASVLRYDPNAPVYGSGNLHVSGRVYTQLIKDQELDIVFEEAFQCRKAKAIKDN